MNTSYGRKYQQREEWSRLQLYSILLTAVIVVVVLRPLEHHVLEEVREAGATADLVARADVVVERERDRGDGAVGAQDDAEPVVEHVALDGQARERGARRGCCGRCGRCLREREARGGDGGRDGQRRSLHRLPPCDRGRPASIARFCWSASPTSGEGAAGAGVARLGSLGCARLDDPHDRPQEGPA